ncbi:MAG: peptidase M24 [Epulopiscium sp. Nele67-Bin004]|nr:MAG: peptidase M24 [Epulopiscium sp. Nele67-Bin004]
MIEKLRQLMKERDLFAYYIPSSDFHDSEYVGEHFKARKFLSGFTGSAGTLVVTQDEAGLWTDGRYFIQAEKELEGTGIKLFKAGVEGVPKIEDYLAGFMPQNGKLGFDGRVVGVTTGKDLAKKLKEKNCELVYNEDLVSIIWNDRPSLPTGQAFLLDEKYTGKSYTDKLSDLREALKEKKADSHILTVLDDIAWLYNLRGSDIKHFPVVLAYTVVTMDEAILFLDETKLTDEIRAKLSQVKIKPYNEIYEYVKNLEGSVLIDPAKLNYAIYNNLQAEKIEQQNPTLLAKAKKNEVEIQNIRNCHLRDGVACTKFMYWLKTNIGKIEITELDAGAKMQELRKQQENYIEDSFSCISAYGENAAMMHYSATPENYKVLEPKNLYLLDSGGQYFDGTTDITRTIALGPVDSEIKRHYTAVARGMLNLSRAKFLHGVRGLNLDILARSPIWEMDIDYRSGTGHGIGFVLNVHEGPNGFRWKIVPERNDSCVLEVGMVTTNEPGIYIEGSHGIRIENELIVQNGVKNEYGQFLEFETVTFTPIDLDAIDPQYMTETEKQSLNNYHKAVFEKISPFLDAEEKEWLKTYTREI